jgi:hypothetical protein
MRWVGHTGIRISFKILNEKPHGKRPLEKYNVGAYVRMILKCILDNNDVIGLAGFIWLRIRSSGGLSSV